MFAILKISKRKFRLIKIFEQKTGGGNPNFYTNGEIKSKELVPVHNAEVVTRKLNHTQVTYAYMLAVHGKDIPEELLAELVD